MPVTTPVLLIVATVPGETLQLPPGMESDNTVPEPIHANGDPVIAEGAVAMVTEAVVADVAQPPLLKAVNVYTPDDAAVAVKVGLSTAEV